MKITNSWIVIGVIRKVTKVCYLKLVAQIPKWHPTCWLTTLISTPPPPRPLPFPTHLEPSFPTNTEFHFWGNGPWQRHQTRRCADWRDVYLCPRCPSTPACRVTNGVRSNSQRQGTCKTRGRWFSFSVVHHIYKPRPSAVRLAPASAVFSIPDFFSCPLFF